MRLVAAIYMLTFYSNNMTKHALFMLFYRPIYKTLHAAHQNLETATTRYNPRIIINNRRNPK